MAEKTSFTFKLTTEQQQTLTQILKQGNYRPTDVPYTLVAAKTPDFSVNLYTSGKCLVQGKGAHEFVQFVLEPCVLGAAMVGYEEILNPEIVQPHMGVDESGKGDFFGPLVVAAAYVDKDLVEKMKTMDVKDSKAIKSDAKALDLGRDLRALLGRRFAIVTIGTTAYNRLYSKMRSVNAMLSWAHARAIEDLLEKVPSCPRAISDQFGSKEQVQRALMKKGRSITLEQRHRAESDTAVAAASILAREGFLRAIARMSEQYGVTIRKGASEAVREAAVDLVKQRGPAVLLESVKCHFRTTDQVLEACGTSRLALPPEGQVMSKAARL
jgi:ribonuclease HIII